VDRTRKSTLQNAEKWYNKSAKLISRRIPFFLVGNKSDLDEGIVISEEDLRDFAEKLDIKFILTSAKTGENINDLFTILAQMCFESQNF
jgi:GTPase SAR1 family protein